MAMQAPHDDEGIYPGTCRPAAGQIVTASQPSAANWRFRVPEGQAIEFEDRHFGPQRFVAGQDFGDFLVWRRDDLPSYQLAVVVDDAAMQITEVVRGADLLKSTARQILLVRALGLSSPAWYHCDLLRDDQGQRLAKRNDALSLRTLRGQGKQPEQLLACLHITDRFSLPPE
jgi:glutamyl-tRNA synthetase